jgi:hypothetical protein
MSRTDKSSRLALSKREADRQIYGYLVADLLVLLSVDLER